MQPKNGKIGIQTQGTGIDGNNKTIGSVGTGLILNTKNSVDVYNSALTTSSIILLSVGPITTNTVALRVTSVDAIQGFFTVKTVDSSVAGASGIPFGYLIIN